MKKKEKSLLKLSKVEADIIERLERPPYKFTSSALASEIRKPRRTVDFNLHSLRKRGVIVLIDGHPYPTWELEGKVVKDKTNVRVIKGIHKIKKKIWALLHSPGVRRYYTVQGTRSVKYQIKFFDDQFARSVHEYIKRKRLIVEGILSQSALREMASLSYSDLLSHKNRLTVVYAVEDTILDFDYDLYVIGSTLCLIDYEKEEMHISNDDKLSIGVTALIKMAEMHGRKINMNDYLNELISNKKYKS